MRLLRYNVGALSVNCYLLINEQTNKAVAIDVGGDSGFLKLECMKNGFEITDILLTHGHFDHIAGAYDFYKDGVKIYMGEKELDFINDDSLNLSYMFNTDIKKFEATGLKDGDVLNLNGIEIKVIETPGHTKGSVSYIVEDKIFDGDVLFEGSFGRIDFPTGNAKTLINSCKKLLNYDGFTLYPGHGEETKVSNEKTTNPILSYDRD
jgi:glyoxylase-like metal-dependent hydrolase (beta-lactamase superfamily II)